MPFISRSVEERPESVVVSAAVPRRDIDDIHAARDDLARTPGVQLLDGHVYELTADPAAIVSTNS